MDLPITAAELDLWINGHGLIQEIFPNLTPNQREFIMTGSTPEEWDAEFGEGEEDYPGEGAMREAEDHFLEG